VTIAQRNSLAKLLKAAATATGRRLHARPDESLSLIDLHYLQAHLERIEHDLDVALGLG
jgi:hypothetical protein